MHTVSFVDIPQRYIDLKNQINDKNLQDIYSKFSFLYLPPIFTNENENNGELNINNDISNYIFSYLSKFKFITYHFSLETDQNKAKSPLYKVSICVENECFIFEQIDLTLFQKIIERLKMQKIEILNDDNDKQDVKTEIQEFCSHFNEQIKNNLFIKITIQSIAGFLIRRFFCPTKYFKNQSFFQFNNSETRDSQIFKWNEFLSDDLLQTTYNFIKLNDNFKKEKISICYSHFKEEDFIKLRLIHSTESAFFYLVIHIKTLYIFMMKIETNPQKIAHEKNFCEKYSHRCITKFYGFLLKQENIIGFIYEYMCNGTLASYVNSNKEKIDDIFILTAINRIFQGINYLHSNSLIHRDLKPLNIFLDNDYLPYISDFDTIRHPNESMTNDLGSILYISPEQFLGKNVSYPTDIYSFGLIIYFLFEKKDMKININFDKILPISDVSENIQSIYKSCVKNEPSERIAILQIRNKIIDEINSFSYFEKFLIQKKSNDLAFFDQFLYENFVIQFGDYKNMMNYYNNIWLFRKLSSVKSTKGYPSLFLKLGKLYLKGIKGKKDYSKAMIYFKLSEQYNELKAYYYIGYLYLLGYGVKLDPLKAKSYFEIAAEHNNPKALFMLGLFYANGRYLKPDYTKAIKYYELSAKLNNSNALHNLGYLYFNGIGVKKDELKAKEFFVRSAKLKNIHSIKVLLSFDDDIKVVNDFLNYIQYIDITSFDPDLLCKIGTFYYNKRGKDQKNVNKARFYFEKAANKNDSTALAGLGHLYFYGEGVEKDLNTALKYYKLSANLGNPGGLYNLGNMYFYGHEVEQDYSKARRCYELAGEQGEDNSLCNLGNIYKKGLGVKQDYKKAKELYELSAQKNNCLAMFNLGNLYLAGLGVEKNVLKSIECFEFCYKHGYYEALDSLGSIYSNGYYVCKDLYRAKYYYELLAQCNPIGYYNLGMLYFSSNYFEQDYSKAKEYFDLGAKLNDPSSLLMLGIMNLYGIGIPINLENAKKFLELSSKSNNSSAFLYLGIYHFEFPTNETDYLKGKDYIQLSIKHNNVNAFYIMGQIYSSGVYFEIDYEKAIYYYSECIKYEKYTEISKKNIFHDNHCITDLTNYQENKNLFYYYSYNKLGTIYLTAYHDLEKACSHIKKAAFFEKAFAQNNLGLLYQFYLNDMDNAIYMYKKASKNHFSLADYNLGYLREKEGNFDEAIKYYSKVSKYGNEPSKFGFNELFDFPLMASKKYIINLVNWKLFEYHLSNSNYVESKKYFLKLNEKNKSTLVLLFLINEYKKKSEKHINNDDDIKVKIQKENQNINFFDAISIAIKNNVYFNITFHNNGVNEIKNLDRNELFKIMIENNDVKITAIELMKKNIKHIENSLYAPPYSILFGCEPLSKPKNEDKLSEKFQSSMNMINESFYEGFNI